MNAIQDFPMQSVYTHINIKYKFSNICFVAEIIKCVQMNDYMKHWMWHFEEMGMEAKKLNQQHVSIDFS